MTSPSPVAAHPPASLIYEPAPGIGESPTLPGILCRWPFQAQKYMFTDDSLAMIHNL